VAKSREELLSHRSCRAVRLGCRGESFALRLCVSVRDPGASTVDLQSVFVVVIPIGA